MAQDGILKKIALGALAGLAGTMVLQAVRTANQKIAPSTLPPVRKDPGKFMADKLGDVLPEDVTETIGEDWKGAVSGLLSFGYGSTGAVLYTAMREQPDVFLDGAALGAAVWAVGYLGWLPALQLAPGINKQNPSQILSGIAQHILYGVATVAAYRKLRQSLA